MTDSSGAAYRLLTILAVQHRLAPAGINLDNLDPAVDLDVIRGGHRELPAGDIAALNNSFGFGGHDVALALRSV